MKTLHWTIIYLISNLPCQAQVREPNLNLRGDQLKATATQMIISNTDLLDTARYLQFSIELELKEKDTYLISLSDFKSLQPVSDLDTLNTLFQQFQNQKKYVLETDLEFSNIKVKNKKEISNLARSYIPAVRSIMNMNYGISHEAFAIPSDSEGAIEWCTELLEPIFGGYTIDLTKDFEYPVELDLSEPNHTFKNTLHIKVNTETENPNIETSMRSSGDEINQAMGGSSFSSDFYMFSTAKYFLREDGKIERVNIHSGNGSKQHSGEMWMNFNIEFRN